MTWVWEHLGDIGGYAVSHALLAGIPLLVGLALALPLGWLARRFPRVAPVIVGGSGLLYTIPSLALFILMPLLLGSRILDSINVYVAMTIYTVALLVRSVVDALGSVPEATALAATSMGYRRVGRARRCRTSASCRWPHSSAIRSSAITSPTATSARSRSRSGWGSSGACCWRWSSTWRSAAPNGR